MKKVKRTTMLPKPEKMVGGTEVYQKEGLPYWFCRLKNGRDEFMHLYTKDLSKRNLFRAKGWWEEVNKETFEEALKNKPEGGGVWLAVYEPSRAYDGSGKLRFINDDIPLTTISLEEWIKLSQSYSPENNTRILRYHNYILMLLRLYTDGFVTKDDLLYDSTHIGHYYDSPDAKTEDKQRMALTGERPPVGGLYNFVGNTWKILRYKEPYPYVEVGGPFFMSGEKERYRAVGVMPLYDDPKRPIPNTVAWIEATK